LDLSVWWLVWILSGCRWMHLQQVFKRMNSFCLLNSRQQHLIIWFCNIYKYVENKISTMMSNARTSRFITQSCDVVFHWSLFCLWRHEWNSCADL
jgi:hypothetical protein